MKIKLIILFAFIIIFTGFTRIEGDTNTSKYNTVVFKTDNAIYRVNEEYSYIDANNYKIQPKYIDGNYYVPLRFTIESLGGSVVWNELSNKAEIIYNDNTFFCYAGDENDSFLLESRLYSRVGYIEQNMKLNINIINNYIIISDSSTVKEKIDILISDFESYMERENMTMLVYNENERLGFKDIRNNIIIEPQFQEIYDFRFKNGMIPLKNGNDLGYLDCHGKFLKVSKEFEKIYPFNNEFARIKNKDGNFNFINRKGKLLSNMHITKALDFSQDLAYVEFITENNEKKCGYLNKQGNIQIYLKDTFTQGLDFRGGLAAVKQLGKWGFIDLNGNIAIECIFETPGYFREGVASVRYNNKYVVIDRQGKQIKPPESTDKYDYVYPFSEDIAMVEKNNKFGFINKKGEMIIDYKFEPLINGNPEYSYFKNGVLLVKFENNMAWIDNSGKIIFTFSPFEIFQLDDSLYSFQVNLPLQTQETVDIETVKKIFLENKKSAENIVDYLLLNHEINSIQIDSNNINNSILLDVEKLRQTIMLEEIYIKREANNLQVIFEAEHDYYSIYYSSNEIKMQKDDKEIFKNWYINIPKLYVD